MNESNRVCITCSSELLISPPSPSSWMMRSEKSCSNVSRLSDRVYTRQERKDSGAHATVSPHESDDKMKMLHAPVQALVLKNRYGEKIERKKEEGKSYYHAGFC